MAVRRSDRWVWLPTIRLGSCWARPIRRDSTPATRFTGIRRARALSVGARPCRHRRRFVLGDLRCDSTWLSRRNHFPPFRLRWPCCWRLEPSSTSSWACTAAAGGTPVFPSLSGSQRPWSSGRLSASSCSTLLYDISGDPAGGSFPRSFWAAEALLSVDHGRRGAVRYPSGIPPHAEFRRLATQGRARPCCSGPGKRASMLPARRGGTPAPASVRLVSWTTIPAWPDRSSVICRCLAASSPWSRPPRRRALTHCSSRCRAPPVRACVGSSRPHSR